MSGLNYLSELKRRNVFKVAVAYLVLSWVILQFVDVVSPILMLPDIFARIVFMTLAILLPVTLVITWAFELTPEGMKRTTDVDEDQSIRHSTGQKINYIIIGLLGLAVFFLLYDRSSEPEPDQVVIDEPTPESEALQDAIPVNSIAVLPFVNMSSDPEQEYFSDGISEEILNVLAQIKDSRVTSRSSSFSFKGQNIDTPTMAKQLGVSKILEGSVRKSGDRIRITAQLIETETDVHLWSGTYDRDLSDIFAVQDEISIAIVDALKTTLNIDVAGASYQQGTSNTEAYEEFLLGNYLLSSGVAGNVDQAKIHFEKATTLDPDYAQAWAMLSIAIPSTAVQIDNAQFDEVSEQQTVILDKALSINPDLAVVQFAQGFYFSRLNDHEKALRNFERAIELNPNYIEPYRFISGIYSTNNQHVEARKYLETAAKIDSMSLFANLNLSASLMRFDQFDEAQTIINRMMQIHKGALGPILTEINLLKIKGQYAEAIKKYHDRVNQDIEIGLNARNIPAGALATIGLYDEAREIQAGGFNEVTSYWLIGDYDEYIKRARASYPADSKGLFAASRRATAETFAGNYQLAQEIYTRLAPCDGSVPRQPTCQSLYYLERKLGNTDQAAIYLQKLKNLEARAIKEGWRLDGAFPNEIFVATTMVMSGDIDQALAIYKQQLQQGYLSNRILSPRFQELHEHPGWPVFLADIRSWQAEQQAKLAELETGE